jgi:hypothetical protein
MGTSYEPAMTCRQIYTDQTKWVQKVHACLRTQGYYYEPEFCSQTSDSEPVVTAARLLGHLYIPSDTDPNKPVILTQPSDSSPQWRPFDNEQAIGWHNDFSTRLERPELSLSWIRQEDPSRPNGGAWRVASVAAVLDQLCQTREGQQLVETLSTQDETFGYRDAGGWHLFHLVFGIDNNTGRRGLRFYGRALEEGAWLRFSQIPDHTREIISRIEEAADAVGETLCASTGSLLIVDNRLSLHDRMEQQVIGPEELRRQAWLCFVQKLHQPL